MKSKKSTKSQKKMIRIHVWSPINSKEVIIEIQVGTTVKALLKILSELWGEQFKPERGFICYRGYVGGWSVLYKTTDGSYYPLGIEDIIAEQLVKSQHEMSRHWLDQTFDSAWELGYNRENQTWDSFIKPEDIENVCLFNQGKVIRRGIIHTGPSGYSREIHNIVTIPEPKEKVDLCLVIIIAVSGT